MEANGNGLLGMETSAQDASSLENTTSSVHFSVSSSSSFERSFFNSSNYFRRHDNDTDASSSQQQSLPVVVLKSTAMAVVMATAIFGNVLVIASVLHDRRLRNRANSFIASMAFADLLVAILVMPFSAVQEVLGRWAFGAAACNVFNANDVLFSTASLLHLCSISVDRYVAVSDPFHYGSKMTRRRASALLVCIWLASALLSHVPIHMGWYTTGEHRRRMAESPADEPQLCVFEVNKIYGLVSSLVSFWTPATVMVIAYRKIFREAKKQERSVRRLSAPPPPGLDCQVSCDSSTSLGQHQQQESRSNGAQGLTISRRLTRHRRMMQRDHKAARTLGVIMGAFLSCWLPFFTWYLAGTMCGSACYTPPDVSFLLFWIGYLNSALNPVIYPFFNRDFRDAFRRLFRRAGCRALTSGRSVGNTSSIQQRSPTGSDFHLVVASNKAPRDVIANGRRPQVCSETFLKSFESRNTQQMIKMWFCMIYS